MNSPQEPRPPQTDLWSALAALIEERRAALTAAVIVVVLGVLLLLLTSGPRLYTSTASFVPQESDGQAGRLAGLAAQFGVSVPSGGGVSTSPQFYADLIRSRRLLTSVVDSTYRVPRDSATAEGDLVTFLAPDPDEPRPLAREATIHRLREDLIQLAMARETGVVTVQVTAPHPVLAQQIAARIVQLVQEFNIRARQTRAAAERQFVEERLAAVQVELQEAESRLQDFLEQNREFRNSPQLQFRYEHLQRQVNMRQQVVVSLVQSLEQAKIDQVRGTPVLTVIEQPEVPLRPDSRNLARKLVIILLLSMAAAIIAGYARAAVRAGKASHPESYGRWKAALARAREDPVASQTRGTG